MNLKTCRAAVFTAAMSAAVSAIPPAFAATPVEEAQTLSSQGDYDGALKRLDKYLATSPQDAEARFSRGLVLVKLNKVPEAIKAFADLTRDYPQLPEPYNNLAVLYAQQGDYEKARDALEAALATHPSYATAHENLGDIYAALAGAAYNRALLLDQANQGVRYKLSLINQLGSQSTGTPAPTRPAAATPPPASSKPVTPPPVASTPPPPVASTLPPAATTTPAAAAGGATQAITSTLNAWASAWSSRDVDSYLSYYADSFKPDAGLSRSEWVSQRRSRIGGARRIAVKVLKPQIDLQDDNHARVVFTQDYSSDAFADKATKTVDLVNDGSGWKITREAVR